jgi:outer membrane protein assembly factor BamB
MSNVVGMSRNEGKMSYHSIAGLAAVVSFLGMAATSLAARPVAGVVSQQIAQRYGLERAWATQVELDQARGRIAHVSLQAGLLLVQTDQATVHVLDAETRRTLWVGHVGLPGAVSSAPAANDKYVVSTNGGMLFLFDRATGKVLWSRKMVSVPSAGPAIGNNRIYVPLVTGMMTTYRLPSENREETPAEQRFKDNALNYAGKGIAYFAPIVTQNYVVWGTDAGNVYAVTPEELRAVFRLKAKGAVIGGLMYRGDTIYAASRDGYIYALDHLKGFAKWQFSIGNPIVETPMATEDGVYAIPETGGLYKLSPEHGEELWAAPGVNQFIAASPTRLYTADSAGRMLIIDAKTGNRIGSMSMENLPIKVFNRDNDRIYLATTTGLVQCLHEVKLKEPARHAVQPIESADEPAEGPAAKKSKAAKPAADEADPFGADDKMEDEDEN